MSRMLFIILSIIAVFGTVSLSGCSGSGSLFGQTPNFTFSVGEGGGFTGFTQGCTLYSTGKIEIWNEPLLKEKEITQVIQIDSDDLLKFRTTLIDNNLYGQTLETGGNMTRHISYTEDETSHHWSWDSSMLPENDWQAELFNLFNTLSELCSERSKK